MALASGRMYVKCCRTKLMKQVLFKLWSSPSPNTGWLLPGHAKLLQGKQNPLWSSYSLTKACKEVRCRWTRKASCGWRKAFLKVLFCTQKTQLSHITQVHCRGSLSAAIPLHSSTHSSGKRAVSFCSHARSCFSLSLASFLSTQSLASDH